METDVKGLLAIDILGKSTGENTWLATEEIMAAKISKTIRWIKTCEARFNLHLNSKHHNSLKQRGSNREVNLSYHSTSMLARG